MTAGKTKVSGTIRDEILRRKAEEGDCRRRWRAPGAVEGPFGAVFMRPRAATSAGSRVGTALTRLCPPYLVAVCWASSSAACGVFSPMIAACIAAEYAEE